MKMPRRVALTLVVGGLCALSPAWVTAAEKDQKSKFYDFSDQLIDGEVKKPPAIVMETRKRAKFERLLSLRKSFRQAMVDSSKEPILK